MKAMFSQTRLAPLIGGFALFLLLGNLNAAEVPAKLRARPIFASS